MYNNLIIIINLIINKTHYKFMSYCKHIDVMSICWVYIRRLYYIDPAATNS